MKNISMFPLTNLTINYERLGLSCIAFTLERYSSHAYIKFMIEF